MSPLLGIHGDRSQGNPQTSTTDTGARTMSPMADSPLHQLDRGLCDLLVAELADHARKPEFARWASRYVPEWMRQLMHATDPDRPRPLLNDDELDAVETALHCPYPQSMERRWRQTVPPYLDGRRCLPELREQLPGPAAGDFANKCKQFVERLGSGQLTLHAAVQLIREWLREIRLALVAMDRQDLLPAPRGSQPTPTIPKPPRKRRGHGQHPSDANHHAGGVAVDANARGNSLPEDLSGVLTPAQAGKILSVSATHVRRPIGQGKLPATNVGRGQEKPRYRIRRADLDQLLATDAEVAPSADCEPRTRPAQQLPDDLVDYFPE